MDDGVHVVKSATTTLSQLCEAYLRDAELKVKDGRIGLGRYRMLKNLVDHHLVPIMGGKLCTDLKANDFREAYRTMVTKGLNPKASKDRIYGARLIVDFGIKLGYLKHRPVDEAIKELRRVDNHKIKVFTPEQVRHLLLTASQRVRNGSFRTHLFMQCAVNLAAFGGLRKGEIHALRLENLDLDRRCVKIRHNLTSDGELKAPKTRAGIRDVPIPAHVVDLLRTYVADHYIPNDQQFVFLSDVIPKAWGNRMDVFTYQKWWPLLQRAGLFTEKNTLHFHALRHFCASWMVGNGVPVTDVAKILGHAKFDMTLQTYAHPLMSVERQLEAVDRMASDMLPRQGAVTGATKTRLLEISP